MGVLCQRFLVALICFLRSSVGIIVKPYETMRAIVSRNDPYEILFVWILIALYVASASLIKVPYIQPYLLTKQFVVIFSSVAASYLFSIGILSLVSSRFGGEGSLRSLAVAWGYTLIPTWAWFFLTSLLYVILPPPRTQSFEGVSFSILFVALSITIFLWKVILAFLVLRFARRMSLRGIIPAIAVSLPVFGLYSGVMYRLGISRVPFL